MSYTISDLLHSHQQQQPITAVSNPERDPTNIVLEHACCLVFKFIQINHAVNEIHIRHF